MSFSISDYAWPAFQGRKPFLHQKHTVKFLLHNPRAFVLNDMGTGKTLSAIWSCDILMTAKKIRRVLVITPKSTMKSVWYNELFLNVPHRRAAIAHGSAVVRTRILKDPAVEFVIINHDGIKSCESEIIAQAFDIVVIDELTAYKTHSSERTKCMKRIADSARAVWGMTGDMTPNSPVEAFSQVQVVNPKSKFLPKYFGQFRDACMVQINEMMWVPKPESPQIVAMVAQPAIRFTRDQCLDLPDTTYQTIETELSSEQLKYYEQMRKDAYIELEKGEIKGANAAVVLNKLMQISAGAVKTADGSVLKIGCEARMDQLFALLDETPQKKLVVFATYRASIEMILEECEKRKVKAAAIHGDVSSNNRDRAITQFQNGPLEMLVLQPQSAAHGITLTAASTVVWFSLVPSNEYFQQGNARIVRAGQTRKTLVVMFASTKAERHMASILERKGDLSAETLRLFADHDL